MNNNKNIYKGNSFVLNSEEKNQNNINEKNYEIIETNGKKTKVITKLSKNDTINENNNQDFHKIMKNPLMIESYAYKFMRNSKADNQNPLKDKDLIQKIRNLIINPSIRQSRNYKAVKNLSSISKRKCLNSIKKDYKFLSKKGFKLLKLNKMKRLKEDAENKVHQMAKIKEKLNLLMEKNLIAFQENKKLLEL